MRARWESAAPGHPPVLPPRGCYRQACPAAPSVARPYRWTLNFQGGSTCRDGALVSTGSERFPQWQASFISGHATSGANRTLRHSPGICKLDANMAFGCHDGAAMWLRLFVGVQQAIALRELVCPHAGCAAVVPDGRGGGGGRGDSVAILMGFGTSTCTSLPSWALLARLCFLREHGSWDSGPVPPSLREGSLLVP